MISTYQIKPAFQKLLRPLLSALHGVGVTPNMLTLTAVLLSITAGYLFFIFPGRTMFLVLALFFLLRMALNALDGMMATTYNLQSKLGEILNEVGDVVSDAAVYLPMVVLPSANRNLVFLFVLMMVCNEFSGVLGKVVGGKRRYDGPMGKSDRALTIGLFLFVAFFWDGVLGYVNYVLLGGVVLMCLSSYFRLRRCLND